MRSAIGIRAIEEAVHLKRVGRTLKGLCPFHDEKTPSFHVDEAKGFYHCFGCGAGGDVFKFVMQQESVTFPEAVRLLAGRAGVAVPQLRDASPADALRDRVLEVNAAAQELLVDALRPSSRVPGAADARDYLERRGISAEVIEQFGLGWAPDAWDFVSGRLGTRFAERELTAAGLGIPRDAREGVYDRFRKRVTFPIRAVSDRIVGFGGRIVGDGEPKYLNSPETPVYTKGRHLYGLDRARAAMRRQGHAVLVEGYLDAIALHAAGIETAVAVLGTALTPEQARLLARFTRKVVIALDGDEAGVRATRKIIPVLLAEGFDVRVLRLPQGRDPDDHVRTIGGEAMARAIESAETFLDFLLAVVRREHDASTPTGRASALNEVLPLIAAVEDPLLRSELADAACHGLGVRQTSVRDELRRLVQGRRKVEPRAVEDDVELTHSESHLIALLLADERARAAFRALVGEAEVETLDRADVYRAILDEPEGEMDVSRVLERLQGEWQRRIVSRHVVNTSHPPLDPHAALHQVRDLVEQMGLSPAHHARRRKADVDRLLEVALRQGDLEAVKKLSTEALALGKAIHS